MNLSLSFMKSFFASLGQHCQHIRDKNTKFKNKELLLGKKQFHYSVEYLAYWFLLPPFQGLHEYSLWPDIFTTINPALSLLVVTQIYLNWYFLMTFLFPRQQIYISTSAAGNIQYNIDLASELPYLMHMTLQSRGYWLFFMFDTARPCVALHSHWNPLFTHRKV